MMLASGILIVATLSWSAVAMQAIKGPSGNWKLSKFLISTSFVAMPGWQRFCVSVTSSVLLEMERDERRRVEGGGEEKSTWAPGGLLLAQRLPKDVGVRSGEWGGGVGDLSISLAALRTTPESCCCSEPVGKWSAGGKETLWRGNVMVTVPVLLSQTVVLR